MVFASGLFDFKKNQSIIPFSQTLNQESWLGVPPSRYAWGFYLPKRVGPFIYTNEEYDKLMSFRSHSLASNFSIIILHQAFAHK